MSLWLQSHFITPVSSESKLFWCKTVIFIATLTELQPALLVKTYTELKMDPKHSTMTEFHSVRCSTTMSSSECSLKEDNNNTVTVLVSAVSHIPYFSLNIAICRPAPRADLPLAVTACLSANRRLAASIIYNSLTSLVSSLTGEKWVF